MRIVGFIGFMGLYWLVAMMGQAWWDAPPSLTQLQSAIANMRDEDPSRATREVLCKTICPPAAGKTCKGQIERVLKLFEVKRGITPLGTHAMTALISLKVAPSSMASSPPRDSPRTARQ